MSNPHEVESPTCICADDSEPSSFCPEHNPLGYLVLGAVVDGFQKVLHLIPDPNVAFTIAENVLTIGIVSQSDYDELCVQIGRMASERAE